MDTIVDQYQWDDRGTAFSTWRKLLQPNEEEWIAFKLCYVISSSIPVDTYEDHQTSIESSLIIIIHLGILFILIVNINQ